MMKKDPALIQSPGAVTFEREVLPTNVRPQHYDISFEPVFEEPFDFRGVVEIELEVLQDTSVITLNASDLTILETCVIDVEDGGTVHVSEVIFDSPKERLMIELSSTISASSGLRLQHTFTGSMLHRATGFFRSPFTTADGKTHWMASTQFEPTGARRAFPCFDEPALKATFAVTLIAEPHLTCLANMPVASTATVESQGKTKTAHRYIKTPPMSTYILALAVGSFNYVQSKAFRVPIRVYATADKEIHHAGSQALEFAARCLQYFEKTFDIPFPLPKIDMIAVPGNQGAMENWGLVTYSENILLVDPSSSSVASFQLSGSVIVHELAHQWFGNIVTMEFWEGLWLNEGFATWAEIQSWQTLEPGWYSWQKYVAGGYQLALELDAYKSSHPIEMPIKKASDINQIFDNISYEKGCAVIRMVSGFLGQELFTKGIQQYLKSHKYGNTTTNNLWDALSEVSGQDVGRIMNVWTQNMGYPVLGVVEDSSAGTIQVTQNRFLQNGKVAPEDDKILYPLSLEVLTKSGIEKVMLYDRSITLKAPSLDFYKLNASQTGFYRVAYPSLRLQTLAQQLHSGHGLVSPEDRIGLLSDVMALAASESHESTSTSDALSFLQSFSKENNFYVWQQIISSFDSIQSAWGFEKDSVVNGLAMFKRKLMHVISLKKGWDLGANQDGNEKMFKVLLFANSTEDDVQKAASDMFESFVTGNKQAIDPNLRDAVFEIALKHGGDHEVC